MSIQTARLEVVRDLTHGNYIVLVRTPHGTAEWPVGSTIASGEHYTEFKPNIEPKPKAVSKKRQKRASIAQETEIMEALGGRRQTGSGAVGHLKGDGRVRNKYRVEAKYTRSGSYRVTRNELSKIRGECSGTEEPLFVIDFVDPETGGSEDRWVLVPFHYFKKLDNAATDHSGSEPPRGRASTTTRSSTKAR